MSFFDKLKQSARAVWSGPFAIGPIAQPISLGAALLRILEVIWKFGIAALVAAVMAIALVLAGEKIDEILNPTLESQIVGKALFAPENCSKEFPILVMLHNNSRRTLASARIQLVVTRSGFSTNLNNDDYIFSDAIVQAGKDIGLCYGMPTNITDDPKTLEYSVKIWDASRQN